MLAVLVLLAVPAVEEKERTRWFVRPRVVANWRWPMALVWLRTAGACGNFAVGPHILRGEGCRIGADFIDELG
jgi:hypothetical protein